MKLLRGTLIGLFVLVVGFLVVWQPMPTQAQGTQGAKSRPVLLEFGRGICPICKQMTVVLNQVKESYGDQVEVRLVYIDKDEPLFQQYKVMIVPTQVFLDASGKEVDRHIGGLSKEEVIKKLEDLKFIR
jgi:thioredoxin 1